MGLGITLGAVFPAYDAARKADDEHAQAAFIQDQQKRLQTAQNAPVPKLGQQIPDDSSQALTADEVAQKLQLDPQKWAEVQQGGQAAINSFLAGHAAANGMYMATPQAPVANQPVVQAQPAAAGMTTPAIGAQAAAPPAPTAATPATPAIPVASAPSAPAAQAAPQAPTEGPYQAYKTSTGMVFTNKTRAATTDDQLLARAGAYMAAGLDEKAVPLLQFATQNKMDQLKLDMMQNEATYAKTWQTANQAMLTQNWGQFQTAINKEFANAGVNFQVAADNNGIVHMQTVDNRTGQLLGSSMFATDPKNNPSGLPDLQTFVASMKDPATALQAKQQLATQAYQHGVLENARINTQISQQRANQEGEYQRGMIGVENRRVGVEAQQAAATAGLARAQIANLDQERQLNSAIIQGVGTPAGLAAINAKRGLSGAGPLAPVYGQPLMPNQPVTFPDGSTGVVRPVGVGKNAVNMPVPSAFANNYLLLSDPYVTGRKIQLGTTIVDGKSVPAYIPNGSPVAIPAATADGTPIPNAFQNAKAAYDQAHQTAKPAIPVSPTPSPGASTGWGQIPNTFSGIGNFIGNASAAADAAADNSQ